MLVKLAKNCAGVSVATGREEHVCLRLHNRNPARKGLPRNSECRDMCSRLRGGAWDIGCGNQQRSIEHGCTGKHGDHQLCMPRAIDKREALHLNCHTATHLAEASPLQQHRPEMCRSNRAEDILG